jgi:phage-related minor tail protein
MSIQVQFRRGSNTQSDAFTGALGEVTVDTTNKTLRVHDGTTQGGTTIAKKDDVDSANDLAQQALDAANNAFALTIVFS